jgi:tRNA (adenine37-N6)-methyltransferase
MIVYESIGVIHSPFESREGMPIQPPAAQGIQGWIEIHEEYTQGLKDLDGFSHIILLYHFHLSQGFDLEPTPFLDSVKRGVFATRVPRRPNPIGLSVVRLIGYEKNILKIEDVDIVNDTPLLDIKPYNPAFDPITGAACGWMQGKDEDFHNVRADDRFSKKI